MNYKKLAQLAHVSESTVSKALSGSRDISTALSDEIFRLALRTGFFEERRRRKQDIQTDGTSVIAILCPEIDSSSYSRIAETIQYKLEPYGIQSAIYSYNFDPEKMNRLIRLLLLRNCADGIITFDHAQELFDSPPIPIVCLQKPGNSRGYDTVSADYIAAMDDAVAYLKSLGHTKIGFIGETHTLSKAESFQNSMNRQSLPCDQSQIFCSRMRFADIGFEAAEHFVKAGALSTAYICAYDEVALGFIHKLNQLGIRVPEDVSVMGFNDIPSATYAQIPLTTVQFFEETCYDLAVELLVEKLRDPDAPVRHITVEHRIVERSSTAPPKE